MMEERWMSLFQMTKSNKDGLKTLRRKGRKKRKYKIMKGRITPNNVGIITSTGLLNN
jgi:hypothetical protein